LPDADNIQVRVVRDIDGEESNSMNFVKDDDFDRPGICWVDPDFGEFGETTNVHGVGFAAANADVMFGTTIDNIGPGCGSDLLCTNAVVPNLVSSDITIQVHNLDANEFYSNPYPFTVLENLTGIPIINELDPGQGPHRQYVTIKGSNFGHGRGNVEFETPAGDVYMALDDFPAQCANGTWSSTEIITIVPDMGIAAINDVEVIVTRSGDEETNDVLENENNFNYNLDTPTPGLCAIIPNNGPQGYDPDGGINLYGDNFANPAGNSVEFNFEQTAVTNDWQTQHIEVDAVPANAQSGNVVVNVNAEESNPLTFTVGECQSDENCSVVGDVCCPTPGGDICLPSTQCDFGPQECEYTWELHTVASPFRPILDYCVSPTPWPDDPTNIIVDFPGPDAGPIESREVYISANLSLFFNRNIYNNDLRNQENFRVYHCDNDPTLEFGANCINPTRIDGSLRVMANGSDQEGLLFNPSPDMMPDAWYDVIFGDTATGFRSQVDGDVWLNGGTGDFDWHFKTRSNEDACEVATVDVVPVPDTSNFMFDTSRTFTALPMSENCNICGNQYQWEYSKVLNGNEDKFILDGAAEPRNLGRAILRSDANEPLHTPTEHIAGNEFVSFTATVNNAAEGTTASGDGTAMILAPFFEEEDHWPDCSDACENSDVAIRFSTRVAPGEDTEANFDIEGLANNPEFIDEWTVRLNGPGSANFVAGQTYTVRIAAGTLDIYGNVLGADYTWDFTVGEQGVCEVARAEISPEDTSIQIGEIENYSASTFSAPGICYPAGQPINCAATPGCSWRGFAEESSGDVARVNLPISEGWVEGMNSPPEPNNTVDVWNWADQGADSFQAITTLTVLPEPPPVILDSPLITDFSPPDGTPDVCIDAMAYVEFDMPMNVASVRDNFQLFFLNDDNAPLVDCWEAPGLGTRLGIDPTLEWYCHISSWNVTSLGNSQFVTGGSLLANYYHLAGVFSDTTNLPYSGASAANGMPLDLAQPLFGDFDLDDVFCISQKSLLLHGQANSNELPYHLLLLHQDRLCLEDKQKVAQH